MPFPSVYRGACVTTRARPACNRGQYDEAISIRAVERFLGDLGQAAAARRGEARETQRQRKSPLLVRGPRPQRGVSASAARLQSHYS